MRSASRRLIDQARHRAIHERTLPLLENAAHTANEYAWRGSAFPDERLEMLFACAHPAIDPAIRTPLILRTVLGIDAGRIASAFCVSPAAMRQRFVRATMKIRDAGIAFEVPEISRLHERVRVVLDAIYAAFGLSWEEGSADGGSDLNRETVWLARVVAKLLPQEREAQALLALVLFVEARRSSRRVGGVYVPLDEQNPQSWTRTMLGEAEDALLRSRSDRPERFAIEATIQAQHVARRHGTPVDWLEVLRLYDELAAFGALGALVSRAAVHARVFGAPAALAQLESLDAKWVVVYQPYWALRAHLTGNRVDYDRAIALAQDEPTRAFLAKKRDAR